MPRFGKRLFVTLACAAFVAACASPTLPLPPPTAPSISIGSEPNTWKLTSVNGAEPGALVVVVSRDTTLPPEKRVTGTIADEQGSWNLQVIGKGGDYMDVSQEVGTTRSPTTTIQLK